MPQVASTGADGSVDVDDEHYYISQTYAGKQVVLFVNAPEKVFGVWLDGHVIKSVPIKGLFGQEMRWEEYVAFIKQQARSRSTSFAGQTAQDAPTLLGHVKFPTGIAHVRSTELTSGARLFCTEGPQVGQRSIFLVRKRVLLTCACFPESRSSIAPILYFARLLSNDERKPGDEHGKQYSVI